VIVCQWIAVYRWFSPGTPVFPINKTDRHDITEILMKVVLNTRTPNLKLGLEKFTQIQKEYSININRFITQKYYWIIWLFNLSILSVPDEFYSRNASTALNLISTFLLIIVNLRTRPIVSGFISPCVLTWRDWFYCSTFRELYIDKLLVTGRWN
jgi:hypothetical protein